MTRTTMAVDPDVLAVAKQMAEARGMSLGETVSFLIRQGLESQGRIRPGESGFYVFDIAGSQTIRADDVQKAIDAEDQAYGEFFKPA